MKKALFSLVVVLGLTTLGLCRSKMMGVPTSQTGQTIQSTDWGGVDVATITFSTTSYLVFDKEGWVLGFLASSNTASTDFVAFHGTDSIPSGGSIPSNEMTRVYLSTAPSFAGDIAPRNGWGTTYKFPAPYPFKKGCAARVSVGTINSVSIFYNESD